MIDEANDADVRSLYRESHRIWGGGLRPSDYLGVWRDVRGVPWARQHVCYLVLRSKEGKALSSVKVYRPSATCDGRPVETVVLGAVFTPEPVRGRGHATELLRGVMDRSRREGVEVALLFSDIDTRFYERLGFAALPASEFHGRLKGAVRRLPAGVRVVPWSERFMDAVVATRRAATTTASFAIDRVPGHWRFLVRRAESFFRRLDDPSSSFRFLVALRDADFLGYAVSVTSRDLWDLREVGVAGASPGALEAVVRAAAADAWSRGARAVQGWLDRSITDRIPTWRIRHKPRAYAVPMVAALAPHAPVDRIRSGEADLTFLDQF